MQASSVSQFTRRNVDDARHQLGEWLSNKPGFGVIMIGMEPIFHLSDKPDRPFKLLMASTPEEGIAAGEVLLDKATADPDGEVEKAYARGVLATTYWSP